MRAGGARSRRLARIVVGWKKYLDKRERRRVAPVFCWGQKGRRGKVPDSHDPYRPMDAMAYALLGKAWCKGCCPAKTMGGQVLFCLRAHSFVPWRGRRNFPQSLRAGS